MSQQINLFNPIFLKQKKHFSARAMIYGLTMVFVGSLCVAFYARYQLAAMESQAAASTAQLSVTKAQLAKVSAEYAPRSKSKALEEELLRVEAEMKSQRETLDIVQRGGLGDTGGYASYMRAFARQIVDGIWLTGFSVQGGDEVEIRGRAIQPELVPAYISRLKNEPALRGKSFSNLVMTMPEHDAPENTAPSTSEKRAAPARRPRFVEFVLKTSEELPASGDQEPRAMTSLQDMAGALSR